MPSLGCGRAATTPSDAGGAIDHVALVRHAKRVLDAGCDGLVLFGSCGEGPSFSISERLAATEAVLRAGVTPARLALGTGYPAIADTVALTKATLDLGITRVLLLPPYYFAGVLGRGHRGCIRDSPRPRGPSAAQRLSLPHPAGVRRRRSACRARTPACALRCNRVGGEGQQRRLQLVPCVPRRRAGRRHTRRRRGT